MKSFRIAVSCLVASGAIAGCSTKDDAQSMTASTSQAITSVNVFHSQQSGGGARGSVYQQDQQSYFMAQFDAWENKSGKTRTASVSFWGSGATFKQVCFDEKICVWDPNTWTCNWETYQYCYEDFTKSYYVYGYGDIPTGDFRVGAHTARLTTDLSKNSSFTALQCGYDSSWNYSCTPMTGTIDLTWRDNGNFTTEQNGVSSMQSTSPYGQYSTHSTGHQSDSSADVSGTFLGVAVSTQGDISLSKETNISKDVFKGPQPPPPDGGLPPPPPPPGDGG
jgi:hypothetical protein